MQGCAWISLLQLPITVTSSNLVIVSCVIYILCACRAESEVLIAENLTIHSLVGRRSVIHAAIWAYKAAIGKLEGDLSLQSNYNDIQELKLKIKWCNNIWQWSFPFETQVTDLIAIWKSTTNGQCGIPVSNSQRVSSILLGFLRNTFLMDFKIASVSLSCVSVATDDCKSPSFMWGTITFCPQAHNSPEICTCTVWWYWDRENS